jgi:hypothetical protein
VTDVTEERTQLEERTPDSQDKRVNRGFEPATPAPGQPVEEMLPGVEDGELEEEGFGR